MPGPTPYDILLTLGAVILGASLWRAFNTSFRAYESTRLDTEALGGDLYTLGQCKQAGGNPKCCKAGMYQNRVDADTVANCKLCNHPNCDDYTTVRNDPTITAPFQLGKFNLEGPPALSEPRN